MGGELIKFFFSSRLKDKMKLKKLEFLVNHEDNSGEKILGDVCQKS